MKGGCDIKPVKKGFVIVSGCVLISDSVVCDQGEKGNKNSILYFEVEVYNIVNRKKKNEEGGNKRNSTFTLNLLYL